jgi:hypothetical protein
VKQSNGLNAPTPLYKEDIEIMLTKENIDLKLFRHTTFDQLRADAIERVRSESELAPHESRLISDDFRQLAFVAIATTERLLASLKDS